MNSIRRTATVLGFAAAAVIVPMVSSPASACDGDKSAEHKQSSSPTNASTAKQQEQNKSDAKSQDKSGQKQADKSPDPNNKS
jgi:hypothetical protein